MVTEPEIAGALQSEPDPEQAAAKLIERANDAGGADNVTAGPRPMKLARPLRPSGQPYESTACGAHAMPRSRR